ncbi:unnamed protein product [Acanthoscelides obtectus]|uniref:protein acetyllysine N-acetyltransferase n=1 Tax=Acanthoscelides obtectus TaxID=200917 RepID=A0A9P0KNV7_ACAOB|nr:unnamed protein product [Acanthoscelides obtectus]CAK1660116.1 NAD-dependent protein deacetylase Sirt6 [Acanthoscelides obtectus]
MSCNYADGLSHYENKGILGTPEKFENGEKVDEKCAVLADWIKNSKHVVIHTGAGISTSAGIPDFRGPNGVWTLEKQGKKPNINISFNDAIPTKTHMALKHLIDKQYVHYIISQNIDGLHLKTGMSRSNIAELHGNMFVEQCNLCESQFVRFSATTSVGQKCLGTDCKRSATLRARSCRGKLYDTILDWEDSLPEMDLEMSDYQSSIADLNICLGTTLQIVPSGNLPLKCKKYGGKVVIVNLQPTKHDKKADLIINTFVDDVLVKVCKRLGLEIPEYNPEIDPTKYQSPDTTIEWNILKDELLTAKRRYEKLNREYRKKKAEEKLFLSKFKKARVLLKKEVLVATKKEEKVDDPKEELPLENKEQVIVG